MTVTLSKRLFEDSAPSSGCLASPPASKKLRSLTPLADHLPTSGHGKAGVPGLGSLQQLQHSSARKRRHDTGAEGTNVAASPPTGFKRGKRGDGRPSTAAASPNTAKSALEALLTYEGLEKDHDLAAEVAYITARQSTAHAAGNAAGPSSTGGPSSSSAQQDRSSTAAATAAGAGSSGATRVQDAARSSREKRRDQDQNPRARRASAGGRSSRDQVASPQPAADTNSAAVAEAATAADPDSPRAVTLDLTADKEWQRLFAVLTISDAAGGRRSNSGSRAPAAAATGTSAAAVPDSSMGTASHRLTDAVEAAPSTPPAAAAGSVLHEAPSTPARLEGGSNSTTAAGQPGVQDTPRRSSFLAGEFSRVQQLHNTPPRPPAARSVRLHTFCTPTHVMPDCDMAM